LAFFTQNKGKLCKILIVTLVFEKNANFFAKNCRKLQKIVIITSTPGSSRLTAFLSFVAVRVAGSREVQRNDEAVAEERLAQVEDRRQEQDVGDSLRSLSER
jgi:hypothetical protein